MKLEQDDVKTKWPNANMILKQITIQLLLVVVEWQMTGMNDEILKIVTAVFIIRQV